MLGAIAGDIIGSTREWEQIKTTHFELFPDGSRFTDDTVLTIAVAEALMDELDLAQQLKRYCLRYPQAGYGGTFIRWAMSPNTAPYGSWGNGSAMRVSSVGHRFDSIDEVLHHAQRTAAVTHDHPEGIKGAQAVALAILLARQGASKDEIRDAIRARTGYALERTIDEIRPTYAFDVSCAGSVPEAIQAFLEADDYEHAVRLAVSLGGDSDTQACIAGGIAEAFFGGVPEPIARVARAILDPPLRAVLDRWENDTR